LALLTRSLYANDTSIECDTGVSSDQPTGSGHKKERDASSDTNLADTQTKSNSIFQKPDEINAEEVEKSTVKNAPSKDPFEKLEFRISSDFSAMMHEFASKEYPLSPVKQRPNFSFTKDSYVEKVLVVTDEKTEEVKLSIESVNKQKAEILKGAMWRRQLHSQPVKRVSKNRIPDGIENQQQQNTPSNTSRNSARQRNNKTSTLTVNSDQSLKNLKSSMISPVSSVVIEADINKRGANSHISRSFSQMANIDNVQDRISLYGKHVVVNAVVIVSQQQVRAKTNMLE
jgi:hypothetical protein